MRTIMKRTQERQGWRSPVRVTALLIATITVLMSTVAIRARASDPRRFSVSSHGLLYVLPDAFSAFFRDSMLVVHLGAHEGQPLPIQIAAYYATGAMDMTEVDVRKAIIQAIEERKDARVEVVAGGPMEMGASPGISIRYDFWALGGIRYDVRARCPSRAVNAELGEAEVFDNAGGTGVVRTVEGLIFQVRGQLDQAAEVRCPARRSRAVTAQRAVWPSAATSAQGREAPGSAVSASSAASTPSASSASSASPSSSANPTTSANPSTSATSLAAEPSTAEPAERMIVSPTALTAARLLVSTDTLRLRVGQSVLPERAFRLRGFNSDGEEIAARIAPMYDIEDFGIARMNESGFVGIAPGLTRVRVRAMRPGSYDASGGASTTFMIKVTP